MVYCIHSKYFVSESHVKNDWTDPNGSYHVALFFLKKPVERLIINSLPRSPKRIQLTK